MRSTLVSPAGSGGLRARLVRGADDAAAPFVLAHDGRFARILLAELVGDDGAAQTRFAWKLRVDEVDARGELKPPTNAELDRVWRQERAELLRVHSPHVVAPTAVPTAMVQSPPVWYCRRVDAYFHPVCPDTGALLTVCRDDALLADAGLPGYGDDSARYLHQGAADGPRDFFRVGATREVTPTGARVLGERDLVRGWARAARGEVAAPDLPCQGCAHRDECFPAGDPETLPAERHLHVVSFYDVDALALELAETDFDAAVMRLGGGVPGNGDRQWMAGAAPAQRALEVLLLKLAAFHDVCRGVLALHEAGRPHLGVTPQNVLAFDDAGSSALPSNWRLRFALSDLGGAIPVHVPGGAGEDRTLWQPGREVVEDETSRLFLAPLLRSLEGGSVTMSVECRAEQGAGGGERLVVDVHRAGVPSFVLPGDLLIVEPSAGGDAVGAHVEDVSARGLRAVVLPGDGGAPSWGGTTFDARLSFVRRSVASADLYGLGMLLLRLLLVHDEQELPDVAATVERCLTKMASSAAEEGVSLVDRWEDILEGDDGEGRFASWNVMHRRQDRQAVFDAELQGTPIVPKPVWRALMTLAGRMLLASPVVRGDQPGDGRSPVVEVIAEIAQVERRLHVELFERDARDAAIRSACEQRLVSLRAELGDGDDQVPVHTMPATGPGAIVAGAAPDASGHDGFVLAVGRVGESAIQQFHFSQDRVTIGRREGENLLHLSDPMVSSSHAVIEYTDGEFVLFDRGSTNGTEVDGIRLPVEVPHPLDDGSVIHIRPFMLSFRREVGEAVQTAVLPVLGIDELYEQLRAAYAESTGGGAHEVHEALNVCIDRARAAIGRHAAVASLEAIRSRLSDAVAAPAADADELSAPALRALRQLHRALTDGPELDDGAQLTEFVGRVQRFVDVTSRWIGEMLEWRRVFGKQLDLRATQTGGVRPPLRTAAEVRAELLVPTGDHDGAATSDYFLTRFFEDMVSILEGLLQGNQRVRQAVREQLDPGRLVAEAGKESKLRILVQAAAGSALWKLYEDTFRSVTEDDGYQAELEKLMQLAADRRGGRG